MDINMCGQFMEYSEYEYVGAFVENSGYKYVWSVCGKQRILKYVERLWNIADMNMCRSFVENSGY